MYVRPRSSLGLGLAVLMRDNNTAPRRMCIFHSDSLPSLPLFLFFMLILPGVTAAVHVLGTFYVCSLHRSFFLLIGAGRSV